MVGLLFFFEESFRSVHKNDAKLTTKKEVMIILRNNFPGFFSQFSFLRNIVCGGNFMVNGMQKSMFEFYGSMA